VNVNVPVNGTCTGIHGHVLIPFITGADISGLRLESVMTATVDSGSE